MPAAVKRRKLNTSAPRINTFAKVSKATTLPKVISEKNSCIDTVTLRNGDGNGATTRKRKLVEEEGAEQDVPSPKSPKLPQQHYSHTTLVPKTPCKTVPSQSSSESIETPTRGARSLLDRFCIAKTPTRSPLSWNSSSDIVLSTPKASSPSISTTQNLPIELLDLINLHAAFLTALSIHYAHNGTHSPADLRALCPDVSRAWGKRRVILDDVRRTLGVMNAQISEGGKVSGAPGLSLSDYGHGKICIEIKSAPGKRGGMARPVNEDLLNDVFARGLEQSWIQKEEGVEMKEWIEKLPMEGIMICSSLLKMSPLLAKGQRRLEDLKMGITVKEIKTKVEEVNADGKRMTLLERLRAKQLHQSTLPAPPSKAELARKAALQRMEEVIAVLTLLSTSSSIGQQRISFTLPTVLGKLKDSFKTPLSKEEGEKCVRLLAADIAPEWVKIVKMGKIEALVVNRDERPSELDIRNRIKSIG
jgi:hypothetical protein